MNEIKIDWQRVPQVDRNLFCRMTLEAVERLFAQPGVQAEFEAWQKDYHSRRAAKTGG